MRHFWAVTMTVLFALVFGLIHDQQAEAAEKKVKTGKKESILSEANYKAACKAVDVADLTKDANKYKGQKVKYTGRILVMDLPRTDNKGNKTTPFKMILSVEDPTKSLPSGVLPIYSTFKGETDSFVYDTVTIYGEVYGNDEYETYGIQKKTLPRVDANYLEKVKAEKNVK